jgi:phage shock protein A
MNEVERAAWAARASEARGERGRVERDLWRVREATRRLGVERDQAALRESLREEEAAVEAWRRRAKAAEDEEKALECLRRHKAALRRVAAFRHRLDEHERSHKELSEGIRTLNAQLSELSERRNLMRTRQSHAEAAHGMVNANRPIGDLEDVFERWEARVGEIEIACASDTAIDAFEASFETAEQDAELRIELEELRREES